MFSKIIAVTATLILTISIPTAPVFGFPQDDDTKNELRTDEAELTLDEVNQRSENAKAVADLDEATQGSIQQLYARARQQLETAKKTDADLKRFRLMIEGASENIGSMQQKVKEKSESKPPAVSIPSDATEPQLQELVRKKSIELTAAREEAAKKASETPRRQARTLELPTIITDFESRLTEVKAQLKAEIPAGESAVVTQARMTQLTAEKQNIETQLSAAKSESAAYEATTDLPPLQAQFATDEVKRLEAEIEAYKKRIESLRKTAIQNKKIEGEELLKATSKPLKPLAQENLDFILLQESTAKMIADVTQREQEIEKSRTELAERFETTQSRVEAIGLNDTLRFMLRQNNAKIKELRDRYKIDASLRDTLNETQAGLFRSQDLAKDLDDIEAATAEFLSKLNIKESEKVQLADETSDLLKRKKQALERLSGLQDDSINVHMGLLAEQQRFVKLTNQYSSYIDEHVMWIRSAKPIGQYKFSTIVSAARQFGSRKNWKDIFDSLSSSFTYRFPMFLVLGSGLVLLFVFQPRLRKNIRLSSETTAKRSCREFAPTATAVMETFLIASLWPMLMMAVGWFLRTDGSASEFAKAFGTGLSTTGLAIAPLEFLRQVCREKGLAESHFDWPTIGRRTIRNNLRWLIPTIAPLMLIAATFNELQNQDWNNSLGRLATIFLLGTTTVFTYYVLRPGGPLFQSPQVREGNFYRLRYLRFAVFELGLLAMIGFAAAGYYYTTWQLGINLIHSIGLAVGLLTLYALSLRFLLVRRRRLRFEQLVQQREQMVKQREAAAAAEKPDAATGGAKIAESLDIDLKNEMGTDINSVTRQARELTGVIFVVGAILLIWQIWADVLPATKLLDNARLWQVAVGEKGETTWVTLRDLLFSVALFVITFFSVRNIPGMLELLLLKRLPLDSGSRYAITTIFRYFITVVGVILALNFLKIPWSKYSWLVAAISVGLGFGLQEIVANFVSGLIILLERPVRVGDVVTIDGTTGIVSRIQMRATTVTNWDNQELVVPNKDLITGKLMNWTLSSVVNRLAVRVGVAYGSDVSQVTKLIEDVAKENEHVLNDPAPLVSFEEFGDSSLNFTLRCCITALEKRFMIIHQLNTAINDKFTNANIVIPFPQRDVHMIEKSEKNVG